MANTTVDPWHHSVHRCPDAAHLHGHTMPAYGLYPSTTVIAALGALLAWLWALLAYFRYNKLETMHVELLDDNAATASLPDEADRNGNRLSAEIQNLAGGRGSVEVDATYGSLNSPEGPGPKPGRLIRGRSPEVAVIVAPDEADSTRETESLVSTSRRNPNPALSAALRGAEGNRVGTSIDGRSDCTSSTRYNRRIKVRKTKVHRRQLDAKLWVFTFIVWGCLFGATVLALMLAGFDTSKTSDRVLSFSVAFGTGLGEFLLVLALNRHRNYCFREVAYTTFTAKVGKQNLLINTCTFLIFAAAAVCFALGTPSIDNNESLAGSRRYFLFGFLGALYIQRIPELFVVAWHLLHKATLRPSVASRIAIVVSFVTRLGSAAPPSFWNEEFMRLFYRHVHPPPEPTHAPTGAPTTSVQPSSHPHTTEPPTPTPTHSEHSSTPAPSHTQQHSTPAPSQTNTTFTTSNHTVTTQWTTQSPPVTTPAPTNWSETHVGVSHAATNTVNSLVTPVLSAVAARGAASVVYPGSNGGYSLPTTDGQQHNTTGGFPPPCPVGGVLSLYDMILLGGIIGQFFVFLFVRNEFNRLKVEEMQADYQQQVEEQLNLKPRGSAWSVYSQLAGTVKR